MRVHEESRESEYMKRSKKSGDGRLEKKKEWLNRARTIQREIWALEDARGTAFDAATGITAKYQPTAGGGGKNPHKIEGYALLTAYIEGRRRELEKVREEIFRAIQTLNSADARTICIHRYINCREWPEVAARLYISERHVHRLHGEALQAIRIDSSQLNKAGKRAQKNEQIIKN